MNDASIEQEIQAKGLTAPRVTPADITANIASEHYFTANDGMRGTEASLDTFADTGSKYWHPELSLLTFCVLTLRNGFTVTGKSACASPENFNAEIGRKIAREDAIQQVWPLMGYALKEQLFQAQKPAQAPVESTIPPHEQRVLDEKRELDEKLSKLGAFIDASPVFNGLPDDEKEELVEQRSAMYQYSEVLGARIARFGDAK
jgi:hypothetical protein